MIYSDSEFARLRNTILSISAIFWIILIVWQGERHSVSPCCLIGTPEHTVATILHANPPLVLMAGWALMLVAMMTPMVIVPIYYIIISSFKKRTIRSIVIFVIGYGALWLIAGCFVIAGEIGIMAFMASSYLPAMIVGLLALVWQASPLKQRCLNGCHRHRSLRAFGSAADVDALRMGLDHGVYCVGSCWVAMLFPMLLPQGHLLAMAFVSLLMFSERLDNPSVPAWRLRGFGPIRRYVIYRWQGIQWRRLHPVADY